MKSTQTKLCKRITRADGTASTNRYVWGKDLSGSFQGDGGVGGLLAVLVSESSAPPHDLSTFQPFVPSSFADFANFARVVNAEAQRRKETQRRETSRSSDWGEVWPPVHNLRETLRLCVFALKSI